ncbi:replication initiation and membrane attachment family protein [Salimicrobium humidisoli]|uniref:Helicase DnaB n=1 Tax=Salimicrobium humidisoli TaxID=2029857 RepID=A0ABX4HU23_9BACI|nr:DnaD domain protein [Salimicrobium humidisoli]PBB06726.1 helicase DnaB [Salimicrobium humidisoli]
MNKGIGKLNPKDCYISLSAPGLEDRTTVLTHLYQPVIGREAVTLFQFLEGEARLYEGERTHHALMTYTGLTLDRIYEARIQLEAIGLLKSFRKEEENRISYAYHLIPPFSAFQFFNDHMLSLLLLHRIGEEKFNMLKQAFSFSSVQLDEYTEVTASFSDVFSPAATLPEGIDTGKETVQQQGVALQESAVDLEWIEKALQERMLPAGKILGKENSRLVHQLAVLYNISTTDMEKAVLWSVTEENELDTEELKASCHDLGQRDVPSGPATEKSEEKKEEQVKEKTDPVSKNEKFVSMLENITPKELLEDMSNGNKATDQDVKLIRNVMTEQGLPKGVMNVLIHYVLLKTDMKLSKPYLEKIASHWARKNVKTVEQAMNMARAEHKKYQEWSKDKGMKKKRSSEVLPAWYKQEKHKEEPRTSHEDKEEQGASGEEIAQRIQRITEKRKGR